MSPLRLLLNLVLLTAAMTTGETSARAAKLELPFSGFKCFDVSEESTANGGRVIQFECRNQSNQNWDMIPTGTANEFRIVNEHSRKCLEISEASQANNAWAQQWDCNDRPHQSFRTVDTGRHWQGQSILTLRPVHSGLCLTVLGGTIADGAQIIQFECNGGTNQDIVVVR